MELAAAVPLNAAAIATAQRVLAASNIGISESNDTTGEPLDSYLDQDRSLRTARAAQVLHQVTQGLIAMHAAGIVHGDLRCGNIFVAPADRILLGGLDHCFDYNAVRFRMLSDKPASELGLSVSRSTRWLAPECVAGGVPTPASDVYAFGLTIYEAMTGEAPYANVEDAKVIEMKTAQAAAATSFSVSSNVSIGLARGDQLDREVWSLIQDMTQSNPMMRPSMQIVSMGMRGLQAKASTIGKQPIAQPSTAPTPTALRDPPSQPTRPSSEVVQQPIPRSIHQHQSSPGVMTESVVVQGVVFPGQPLAPLQPAPIEPAKVYPAYIYTAPSPASQSQPPTASLSRTRARRKQLRLLAVAIGIIVGVIVAVSFGGFSIGGSSSDSPSPPTTPSFTVETLVQGTALAPLLGIVVTRNGTVLVADETRIYKLAADSSLPQYIGRWHNGYADGCGMDAMFDGIHSLAIDSNDTVYITDANNRRVRSFQYDRNCVTNAAGDGWAGTYDSRPATASFTTPAGLAVDGYDNVYITDYIADSVRKLTPSTPWVSTPISSVNGPGAIAVARTGEIYIVQQETIVTAVGDGFPLTVFVGDAANVGYLDGFGTTARFNRISGIALSSAGDTLFVADTNNHCIRKVEIATRQVTTLAGTCGVRGTTDGAMKSALFEEPYAIAVHGSNTLYVTEIPSMTVRVRKITL